MVSTLDYVTVILLLVLTAVLSIYKLVQIYRYRNDPAKCEQLANTTQIFPEKIRRWVFDENYNKKHGIGRTQ